MENKKYVLSSDPKDQIKILDEFGREITLTRIVAVKDITMFFGQNNSFGVVVVKKGEKGGYVQSEKNLSQSGTCWIYDDAKVYGNAFVREDAVVRDKAEISGHKIVSGNEDISKTPTHKKADGGIKL